MSKIEIPLNNNKVILLMVASVVFFVLGLFMILSPEQFSTFDDDDGYMVILVGILSLLLGGAGAYYSYKMFSEQKVGITIDQSGITDYSNSSSVGFIPWADITDIQSKEDKVTQYLLIMVKNPEAYLDKASTTQRMILKEKLKLYATPISIITTVLKCNFEELEKAVLEQFNEYQNKN